jgi:hypothetical protein
MNVEHRTLNVQHRILNSVNLKNTEHHAAYTPLQRQALARRVRCVIESTIRNPTRLSALQASVHFFKIDKA